MTKKQVVGFLKIVVTPSVAAPGDTNPSDATGCALDNADYSSTYLHMSSITSPMQHIYHIISHICAPFSTEATTYFNSPSIQLH